MIVTSFKLFESFDANKLNKTLAYINDSNSKKMFVNDLIRLSKMKDFPASMLSDDLFQYLGYKSAMRVINYPQKGKCKHESPWIPGEYCQDGRIKRTWGNGTRMTECPACNGTGEAKAIREDRYLKFWFTVEGIYKGTTITNGVQEIDSIDFSSNIDDYEVIKEFRNGAQMKREVEIGDIISFRPYRNTPSWHTNGFSNPYDEMVGVIMKDGTRVYAIQSEAFYGNPSTWGWNRKLEWRKFGGRYYSITQPRAYEGQIKLLKRKDESTDPTEWNHGFNVSTWSKDSSVKEHIINDAAFALVFDLKDFHNKSVDAPNLTDIKSDRVESRKGALAFMSNEEVKKANISKYMDEISNKVSVDIKDLRNLNNTFRRLLGFNNMFLIRKFRNIDITDNIDSIIKKLYHNMTTGDPSIEDIVNNLKRQHENISYNISQSKSYLAELKADDIYQENLDVIEDVIKEWGYEANKSLSKVKTKSVVECMAFKVKAKSMLISNRFPYLGSCIQTYTRSRRYGYSYQIRDLVRTFDEKKFLAEWKFQKEYIKKI